MTSREVYPLLRLNAVGHASQGHWLLEDITCEVRAGELVTLLGPNGAGKSTLLRVLAREHRRYTGSVRLMGRELCGWRPGELARLRAVMPQQCPVAFGFTAAEVVALGLPGRQGGDVRHPAVRDLMAWLDVRHLARRPYASLSGGEQQRVQLGRVLAQVWQTPGPRLLLLDECTSALDPAQQYRIMAMLRTLAAEARFAVIAACHDLALAAAHADRVLLMAEGGLRADGTPAQVMTTEQLAVVYRLDARVEQQARPVIHIRGCVDAVPPLPATLAADSYASPFSPV